MTKTTLIIADNQPLTSYALKTWAEKNELVDSVIESQDKQDLEDLLDKLSQEEVMLIMDVELFDFADKDELIVFFRDTKVYVNFLLEISLRKMNWLFLQKICNRILF